MHRHLDSKLGSQHALREPRSDFTNFPEGFRASANVRNTRRKQTGELFGFTDTLPLRVGLESSTHFISVQDTEYEAPKYRVRQTTTTHETEQNNRGHLRKVCFAYPYACRMAYFWSLNISCMLWLGTGYESGG